MYNLTINLVLTGTPSIFYSLVGCMSPLHVKKQRKHARESRKKPSVKVGVHGGIKKQELALHQACVGVNLPLECTLSARKVIFLEFAVNYQCTSKLQSCGPVELHENIELQTYVPTDLHTYGAADLCTSIGSKSQNFTKC